MDTEQNKFVRDYKTFLTTMISAFVRNEENSVLINKLRKETAAIFEDVASLNHEIILNLLQTSEKEYETLREQKMISDGDYLSLVALTTYVRLISKIDISQKQFKRHLEIIKRLFAFYDVDNPDKEHHDNEALVMVYNHLIHLLSASFVPLFAKEFYHHYKRALPGENQLIDDTIRIFVAKTGQNFTMERHVLENLVAPEMQTFCKNEFGLSFEIVNIDCALNEHNSNDFNTLYNVLVNAGEIIKNTKPYFFLFTNETYGTEIDSVLINNVYTHLDLKKPISIAHLQYLLRTYLGDQKEGILLFHKNDTKTKDEKLQHFITTVQAAIPNGNHFLYTTDEEYLANQITTKLKTLLIKHVADNSIFEYSELKLIRLKNEVLGFDEEIADVLNKVKNNYNRLLVARGEAGIGKTMFLAKLYDELVHHGYNVFPYLLKDFKRYRGEEHLLEYVRYKLEQYLNLPHEDFISFEYSVTLVKKYAKKLKKDERFIILIDDLDLLIQDGELFAWFSTEFSNITFVGTVTNEDYVVKLSSKGAHGILLKGLRKQYFDLLLQQKAELAGKVLHPEVSEYLRLKFAAWEPYLNPLHLSLLFHQLFYIDGQELKSICTKHKNNKETLFNALGDYHTELINHSAPSLERLIDEIVNQFIKNDKNNDVLLSLLAFTELRGIALHDLNRTLRKLKRRERTTSFLDLKTVFGELVDVNNYDFARITNIMLVKAIFRLVNNSTLKKVAEAMLYHEKHYDKFTLLKCLVYNSNSFKEIIAMYGEDEPFIDALILESIFSHHDSQNYAQKFIENVNLEITALEMIKRGYDTYLWLNHKINEPGYLFLAKVLDKIAATRFKDGEHQRILSDHYAILGTKLLKAIPDDKAAFYINKQFDLVLKNIELFFFDSAHFFRFLSELTKLTEWMQSGNKLRTALYETVLPRLKNLKPRYLETTFAIIEFQYYIHKLQKEKNEYLEKYCLLYDKHYQNTIKLATIHKQIDYLYFILTEILQTRDNVNIAKYFPIIYRALNNPRIIYRSKDELVKIEFEIKMKVAILQSYQLRTLLFNDNLAISPDDKAIKDTTILTSILISDAVKIAQNWVDAHITTDVLSNFNTANFSYVTFHALVIRNVEHALDAILGAMGTLFTAMDDDIYSHDLFMNFAAFAQVYSDYLKQTDTKIPEAVALYIERLKTRKPRRATYDVDSIIKNAAWQRKVFNVEKSEEMALVEQRFDELIKYLGRLHR